MTSKVVNGLHCPPGLVSPFRTSRAAVANLVNSNPGSPMWGLLAKNGSKKIFKQDFPENLPLIELLCPLTLLCLLRLLYLPHLALCPLGHFCPQGLHQLRLLCICLICPKGLLLPSLLRPLIVLRQEELLGTSMSSLE